MAALAANIDLSVQAGATWVGDAFIFKNKATGNPIDLTGYEARMQIRKSLTDPAVVMELTTANGKLQLSPLLGRIDIIVSALETSGLAASYAQTTYVYGIELFTSGDASVISLATGKVTVAPEVVHDAP